MSDNVKWIQWTSKRTGVTKAFAVDAAVLESKGTVRAINGSIVPDEAEPAKRGTEKDEFCLRILESRKALAESKAERARGKALAKKEKVAVKAVAVKARAKRKDAGKPRRVKATAVAA